jgi:hypothetical protein
MSTLKPFQESECEENTGFKGGPTYAECSGAAVAACGSLYEWVRLSAMGMQRCPLLQWIDHSKQKRLKTSTTRLRLDTREADSHNQAVDMVCSEDLIASHHRAGLEMRA